LAHEEDLDDDQAPGVALGAQQLARRRGERVSDEGTAAKRHFQVGTGTPF
jgi:hypothetical protein